MLTSYKSSIFDIDGEEQYLLERYDFIEGKEHYFKEPNSVGYSLLTYPLYKIVGFSGLFNIILASLKATLLALSIFLLFRITKSYFSLCLLYPFARIFTIHTIFDLSLVVVMIYAIHMSRHELFYWFSAFCMLFRPEFAILPIVNFLNKNTKRYYVYVSIAVMVLLFLVSQWIFYGNPLAQLFWNISPPYSLASAPLAYRFSLLVGILIIISNLIFAAFIYFYHNDIFRSKLYLMLSSALLSVTYLLFIYRGVYAERYGYFMIPLIVYQASMIGRKYKKG